MTPIEQIEKWIKDKPVWWRQSVRLALENGGLDGELLSEAYELALIEHGLADVTDEFDNATQPIDFSGHTSEEEVVNIRSLGDVLGVGALAKNQTIDFNQSGLFIVYGDNGAGKSSYANILKSACLTRGSDPNIIGNVFEANNPSPSAEISFTVGAKDDVHSWTLNEPSTGALKAIRVFDTSSAHHYVNKEDTLGFKPSGLNLLNELTAAVNYVKGIVDEEIMPGNGFVHVSSLNSLSDIAKVVNNLSYKHEESDIETHKATTKEVARIEPLRQEIAHDKLQTPETLKKKLRQQKELLKPLGNIAISALKCLGDESIEQLRKLQQDYEQKKQQAEAIKKATLDGLPLDTVTGIRWQEVWKSAKQFVEQEPHSNHFPPEAGDNCPLCLQVISEESGNRLAALQKFLSDNAATEAKKAYESLQNLEGLIRSQDLRLQEHKTALDELESIQPGLSEQFTALFEKLSERKRKFITNSELPSADEFLDISAVQSAKQISQSISEQIEAVQSDEDLAKLIEKKEQELQRLEDKKFVLDNFEALINNLRRHKVVKKLEGLKKQCNPLKISILSSSIYKQGVIEPLETAFAEELHQFGFTRFSIQVQTRNTGGNQQFKLAIADAGEPIVAKVASEGEQRCIAIAAFLAEMKADNRDSTVIFDDPVNSLSHQWSSRVAARLVDESKKRQVVVFTHDIVFFKLLLEQAELQDAEHNSIALVRNKKYAGLVKDFAPWEALTTGKRLKVLNVEFQKLRKIEANETEDEFRKASRHFYGLLRESWERLVEEKLLNKVVNRFERGVYTQRLSRLVDITDADIARVDNAMTKCSTYFTGHDSSAGVGDPYPTIDEVSHDLEDIKMFLEELQGARKRS
ncbi:AAA family ATPase [Pseudidiomarina sediminum]|uniref:AAA family ATPase n=1 Tax=Pseudidiomarina sediminum TaxID=431675 RepID=UPI001C97E3EB|nr:AAA family ATPase [Pseudidiomarina sediminum]MBY6063311.1 AAA family ATPase [Pseudidiomarina sediminum]